MIPWRQIHHLTGIYCSLLEMMQLFITPHGRMINLLICFSVSCFISIFSNWITAKLSPFPKRQQEKKAIQYGHYLLVKLKISIAFWFMTTLEKWWENSLPNITATIQHSATDQSCLFCSDQFCCVNRSEYFESTAQHFQLILTDSMEGKFSLPPSPPLALVTTINEHFNWSTGE